MSRRNHILVILTLFTLFFYSCDTSESVRPRNESFFIKYYAGPEPGDQSGADIIETADGGLLLLGTSKDSIESLIAIKTDVAGNVEWDFSSSGLLPGTNCVGKSVIQLPGTSEFVLGGTKGTGNDRQVFLIILDASGNYVHSSTVVTEWPDDYHELSKITLTYDYLVLSGETSVTAGVGTGTNGFLGLLEQDLSRPVSFTDPIVYFGIDGDEIVAGAYELENITQDGERFVVYGASTNGSTGDYDYFATSYNEILSNQAVIGIEASFDEEPGDQLPANMGRLNDRMFVVGKSLNTNQVYLKEWREGIYQNDPDGTVGGTLNIEGTGVTFTGQRTYISGNQIFSTDIHEEALIAEVKANNVFSPWPRHFGNSSSVYSTANLTVLQDGSIVMIGTADLQPIKKIMVVKTGPKGEMSFE